MRPPDGSTVRLRSIRFGQLRQLRVAGKSPGAVARRIEIFGFEQRRQHRRRLLPADNPHFADIVVGLRAHQRQPVDLGQEVSTPRVQVASENDVAESSFCMNRL